MVWDWLTEEEQNLIASTMLSAHRWDKRCAAREREPGKEELEQMRAAQVQFGRVTPSVFREDAVCAAAYEEREKCGFCDEWRSLEERCFTCEDWDRDPAKRWKVKTGDEIPCVFRDRYAYRHDACRAWVRHPKMISLLQGECLLRGCLREYVGVACRAFRRKK